VSPAGASQPASLVELLEASVARHGPRPLFLERRGGRWVATSYAAFAELVDAVRAGLGGLGVGPGDRVGIISRNRLEWAAVAYATYGRNAVLVPMYESQREIDWAFVIRDAGVSVLFVPDSAIAGKIAARAAELPTLRRVVLIDAPPTAESTFPRMVADAQKKAREPVLRPTSRDVAALLYTSGTTGEPKGVILTHGNIVSNVTAVMGIVPVAPRHRTLSFLPWAHAFGHTLELHGVIAAGASTAIAESVDKIVDNLAEVRPTVLIAVPRVFLRVHAGVNALLGAKPRPIRWLARRGLDLGRRRSAGERLTWFERCLRLLADRVIFSRVRRRVGGRLEFAISGAAALPKQIAEMVDALGIPVYEGYGLTEASPIVSANVPGHRKFGSVGRPLPGVRVEIDRTGTGDDPNGEIVVYGPNVTRGYHGRPEDRRALLTEAGGLRTGDVGQLDDDGYLYVTGRIKEQYKLANGKYVSPAGLEERLKLSPFIADVMICGEGREHNVALVVPDLAVVRTWAAGVAGERGDDRGLLEAPGLVAKGAAEVEAASKDFRGYERIAAFALLPEGFTQQNGLLTPTLKLKRREIVARWGSEIDRLDAEAAGAHAQRAATPARTVPADPPSPPPPRGAGA
jgi:long-chain acyl-CoA synthetase